MVDLTKLALRCNVNAKRLGYKTDRKNTIKALKNEIKELKRAKRLMDCSAPYKISCIRDNKKFIEQYEKFLKGTIHDELPDIILPALSLADKEKIDIETDVMNKIRYNEYR